MEEDKIWQSDVSINTVRTIAENFRTDCVFFFIVTEAFFASYVSLAKVLFPTDSFWIYPVSCTSLAPGFSSYSRL
jgi:hypothetical protein